MGAGDVKEQKVEKPKDHRTQGDQKQNFEHVDSMFFGLKIEDGVDNEEIEQRIYGHQNKLAQRNCGDGRKESRRKQVNQEKYDNWPVQGSREVSVLEAEVRDDEKNKEKDHDDLVRADGNVSVDIPPKAVEEDGKEQKNKGPAKRDEGQRDEKEGEEDKKENV